MVAVAAEYARAAGHTVLEATYLPTPKNEPCLDFLKGSAFEPAGAECRFQLDLGMPTPVPRFVEVVRS